MKYALLIVTAALISMISAFPNEYFIPDLEDLIEDPNTLEATRAKRLEKCITLGFGGFCASARMSDLRHKIRMLRPGPMSPGK